MRLCQILGNSFYPQIRLSSKSLECIIIYNSIINLGMPDVELGINDMWRQGKEVVGRHDIIPVVTEEWIRLENVEFHSCVQQDEYEKSRIIKYVSY